MFLGPFSLSKLFQKAPISTHSTPSSHQLQNGQITFHRNQISISYGSKRAEKAGVVRYYTRRIMGFHERPMDALSVTGKDITFQNGLYVHVWNGMSLGRSKPCLFCRSGTALNCQSGTILICHSETILNSHCKTILSFSATDDEMNTHFKNFGSQQSFCYLAQSLHNETKPLLIHSFFRLPFLFFSLSFFCLFSLLFYHPFLSFIYFSHPQISKNRVCPQLRQPIHRFVHLSVHQSVRLLSVCR